MPLSGWLRLASRTGASLQVYRLESIVSIWDLISQARRRLAQAPAHRLDDRLDGMAGLEGDGMGMGWAGSLVSVPPTRRGRGAVSAVSARWSNQDRCRNSLKQGRCGRALEGPGPPQRPSQHWRRKGGTRLEARSNLHRSF